MTRRRAPEARRARRALHVEERLRRGAVPRAFEPAGPVVLPRASPPSAAGGGSGVSRARPGPTAGGSRTQPPRGGPPSAALGRAGLGRAAAVSEARGMDEGHRGGHGRRAAQVSRVSSSPGRRWGLRRRSWVGRSSPCWEGSGEPRSPRVILISARVLPSPEGCRGKLPSLCPLLSPALGPRPSLSLPPPRPSREGCPDGPGGRRRCRGKRPTVASERAASLPSPGSGTGWGGEGRAGGLSSCEALRPQSIRGSIAAHGLGRAAAPGRGQKAANRVLGCDGDSEGGRNEKVAELRCLRCRWGQGARMPNLGSAENFLRRLLAVPGARLTGCSVSRARRENGGKSRSVMCCSSYESLSVLCYAEQIPRLHFFIPNLISRQCSFNFIALACVTVRPW